MNGGYVGPMCIRCPCCGDERDVSKRECRKLEREYRPYIWAPEVLKALTDWCDLCDNVDQGIPKYVLEVIEKATGKKRKYVV